MFEIAVTVAFIWLFIKVLILPLKVAWCVTKGIAAVLFVLSLPLLILGLVFSAGVGLLLPLLLVAGALRLLKSCH